MIEDKEGDIMNYSKKIELINALIEKSEKLPLRDDDILDAIRRDAEMILRNIFGDDIAYIRSLNDIRFHPMVYPSSEENRNSIWSSGQRKLINLFQTIKKELEIFHSDQEIEQSTNISDKQINSRKVFIVHGHDEGMKLDVARTLEKLEFEPIILHEQVDDGQTIIEKFENNSIECGFAVILLSPDDKGYSVKSSPDDAKFRARQNVILELGYFVGKISRKNVLTLVKSDPTGQLEIPSDLAGIIYTPYDNSGGWKEKLIRSLRSSGYEVDANKIF